jgi:hypothetical protein
VDPNSAAYIASINNSGGNGHLHADFGSNLSYGIPYQYVSSSVAKSPVTLNVADESDPGPYPIPANPLIEQGSDGHMLLVDTSECKLYELDQASHGSGWNAYSGAIWDLKTNSTRPTCWTSADAAGLPIFPGLARYEEAKAAAINHALRFTADKTQQGFVPPAGHYAPTGTSTDPPMGLRLRLKSSFNINAATPQAKIILAALQKYGMILADNGTSWYISGASDANWDDNDLDFLKTVPGTEFEAIKIGPLTTSCP